MTPSIDELIIIPFALNKTVSFSKMSTKISFDLFFFASSLEMGLVIAKDDTVLEEKIFGFHLDPVEAFYSFLV
jgi:hypothetical protein